MVGQIGETARMGHFEAKSVCYSPRFWGGPRVRGFRRLKIDPGMPGRLSSVPVLHDWAWGSGLPWAKNQLRHARKAGEHPSVARLSGWGHLVGPFGRSNRRNDTNWAFGAKLVCFRPRFQRSARAACDRPVPPAGSPGLNLSPQLRGRRLVNSSALRPAEPGGSRQAYFSASSGKLMAFWEADESPIIAHLYGRGYLVSKMVEMVQTGYFGAKLICHSPRFQGWARGPGMLGKKINPGMIPQEIGNLVNLAELAMEINQITGLVPISILNNSSLQILSLSMNNFSGFLPQEISNLTKMQNLQLGDNKLIAEIPKEISNLVELEVLDLSGNSFSGSLDMEIFNISGMRVISISNNNLSGSLPPNMCSLLPNIEKLYMNNLTNLVGTIPHSISNCSELTILELSNNQLTGLIPNSLGHLAHLQFLNLERNSLTNDSMLSFLTSLTSCRSLTFLSVYLNSLNGMLPASTGNLSTSLRTFAADICKIKG
ncbi:hypothetical protein BC332_26506 [Capsicum chinense]|nr:hypothetical protein BC332_26506 [Capsicum chinense]